MSDVKKKDKNGGDSIKCRRFQLCPQRSRRECTPMPAFNLQRESYNGSSIKAKFVSMQRMTPRLPRVARLTQLGHSTQNPLTRVNERYGDVTPIERVNHFFDYQSQTYFNRNPSWARQPPLAESSYVPVPPTSACWGLGLASSDTCNSAERDPFCVGVIKHLNQSRPRRAMIRDSLADFGC